MGLAMFALLGLMVPGVYFFGFFQKTGEFFTNLF